jgi:hypothetical protein
MMILNDVVFHSNIDCLNIHVGHENKDLFSEAINSFRLFDILKLWETVHLPWEAVQER